MSFTTKRGNFKSASQVLSEERARKANLAASSSRTAIELSDSDEETKRAPIQYSSDDDLPPPLDFPGRTSVKTPKPALPSATKSTSTDPSPGTAFARKLGDRFSFEPGAQPVAGPSRSTHFDASARSISTDAKGKAPARQKSKRVDDLEDDIAALTGCPFCDNVWTTRKTAVEKAKHVRKCAKANGSTTDESIRHKIATASLQRTKSAPTVFERTIGELRGSEVTVRMGDAPGPTQAKRDGDGLIKAARKAVKDDLRLPGQAALASKAAAPVRVAAVDDFDGSGLTQRPRSASPATPLPQDSSPVVPPTQRFAPSKLAARRANSAGSTDSGGKSMFKAAAGQNVDEGISILDRLARSKRQRIDSNGL